jgi:hypothetical protein
VLALFERAVQHMIVWLFCMVSLRLISAIWLLVQTVLKQKTFLLKHKSAEEQEIGPISTTQLLAVLR